MMAHDNSSHMIGDVLCQGYFGSHLHVGLRVELGCNLTMVKEDLDWTSGNGKGHCSEIW